VFCPQGFIFKTHVCNWIWIIFKYVQLEKGWGDNQIPHEASLEITLDDIEALASTNEYYKKRGCEATSKNLGSPSVS